jgi:hypothetical protein
MENLKENCGFSRVIVLICIAFLFLLFFGGAFALYYFKGRNITTSDIAAAEKITALHFTAKDRKMMLNGVRRNSRRYENLRQTTLDNQIPPALLFNPVIPGMNFQMTQSPLKYTASSDVRVPSNFEDLAFFPVTALAQLIKSRRITSTELTHLYLSRLKKYGPQLECVITLTEELALQQAKRADEEIASGKYRGPLHVIP